VKAFDGEIGNDVERAGLRAVQTPQAFHYDKIRNAFAALDPEASLAEPKPPPTRLSEQDMMSTVIRTVTFYGYAACQLSAATRCSAIATQMRGCMPSPMLFWGQYVSATLAIISRRQIQNGIQHVDITLICEKPKIKPHRGAMRERVAELLALPLTRVSVKATTTEKLGFTGRGEGLAAQAAATVKLPE